MPHNHLILCCPLFFLPSLFLSIRVFSNESPFTSGSQSIGASASTSVPPMNIQDWSPLGWTPWISLQSKGLSRVFSNTTVQKHQFFSAQSSLWSNFHICTWLLEKPYLWLYGPLSAQSCLLFNTLCSFVMVFLPRSKWLFTLPEYFSVATKSYGLFWAQTVSIFWTLGINAN